MTVSKISYWTSERNLRNHPSTKHVLLQLKLSDTHPVNEATKPFFLKEKSKQDSLDSRIKMQQSNKAHYIL